MRHYLGFNIVKLHIIKDFSIFQPGHLATFAGQLYNDKALRALDRNNFLVVLVGPTAVGKTAFGIRLAKALHCQVISADSRQFYKELSIGTAKPSKREMAGIDHHFVDFLSIQEEFSAGRFELAALDVLRKIYVKNPVALMVGGSGLYVQAVCHGMNDIPQIPGHFRETLYVECQQKGLEHLLDELRFSDPVYYDKVDKKNQQRVIRALEICRATGRPYSSFRQDKKTPRDFQIIKIGLDMDRAALFERIDNRMDQMIEAGLFEEAEKWYPFRHLNALKTVGYTEIFDYLDGQYHRQEAVRLLKRNSRRYAKRQLTWFKKDQEITWYHPKEFDRVLQYLLDKMGILKTKHQP